MKKVLIPTDFSPNALRAVQYAIEIARRSNVSIHLLHVCDTILDPVLTGHEKITRDYNSTICAEAQQNLNRLQESIIETENLNVTTELAQGSIKEGILKAAAAPGVDLVIMGTLGRSGLKEQILGSKTASIIGRSTKPVLAIPIEYEWRVPEKILLTIKDYSEAKPLLMPLMELADFFAARLQLAIFTDEDKSTAIGYKIDDEYIRKVEEKMCNSYPALHAESVHLLGSDFMETLNHYINQKNVDMVCMITHRRNLIDSLFNRSLTKKMAYHSKIPLLAIPTN